MKSFLCTAVFILMIGMFKADDDVNICDQRAGDLCRGDFEAAFNEMNTFLPNAEILYEHCEGIKAAISCLIDYEDSCPGGTPGFNLEGTLDFIKRLCNKDSEIGKAYNLNVDCYNTIGTQLKKCLRDVQNISSSYRNALARNNEVMGEAAHTHINCVTMFLLKNCFTNEITVGCGVAAVESANQIVGSFPGYEIFLRCSSEDQHRYEEFTGNSMNLDIMIN